MNKQETSNHNSPNRRRAAEFRRAHAVTPMEAVAGTLSKRKDKSALHLSRYVVDASRNAALSRGDLNKAQNVRHVAAVRSHLWPERQDCAIEQMAVNIAILNV
jgi:hypothetical protein